MATTISESGGSSDAKQAGRKRTARPPTASKTKAATSPGQAGDAPDTSAKRSRSAGRHDMIVGAAAAAAGVLAGLAVHVGRKAAVQAVSTRAVDWMAALKNEHAGAIALFDKIEATSETQTTKRAMLLGQLKHALSKHAFEEENVVYPALRDQGRSEVADRLNHDHGYVKQFLHELDTLPKGTVAWTAKVVEFRAALERHVREEEDDIFLPLHAALSDEANKTVSMALHREGFKLA